MQSRPVAEATSSAAASVASSAIPDANGAQINLSVEIICTLLACGEMMQIPLA